MLRIATAARPPLMSAIVTTAATLFFFQVRSAKKIVLAVVIIFRPNIDPLLLANGADAGLASRAPALMAADVLNRSHACTAPSITYNAGSTAGRLTCGS